MTVDREQIRRDAEWLRTTAPHVWPDRSRMLGDDIDALLAELEQAERKLEAANTLRVQAERDVRDAELRQRVAEEETTAAEARLAKADALAEAVRAGLSNNYFTGEMAEALDAYEDNR